MRDLNRNFEKCGLVYIYAEAISQVEKKGNDGISTLATGHSTTNTLTEASAKSDFGPDRSFIINQYIQLNYMWRKGYFAAFSTSDDRDFLNWDITIRFRKQTPASERLAILFNPSDFGGIPLSTYISHTIRGYDDKLPLWISLIKSLKNINRQLYLSVSVKSN